MLARIHAALAHLEATQAIRVLYACESGSRAWGFASPDSDYDVRFIYHRAPAWYLTLDEGRDTLDFPVDDALDLAGWDLRKALRLLRGSNAAVFEWLQSPVVYAEALDFRVQLAPLAGSAFNLKAGLHHYLGQLRRCLTDDLTGPSVRLKRLFYALRSALAARWIRQRHALPPMQFAPLCELLPPDLAAGVAALLRQKTLASEKATTSVPAALLAFLQAEHAAGLLTATALPLPPASTLAADLDGLFRALLSSAK